MVLREHFADFELVQPIQTTHKVTWVQIAREMNFQDEQIFGSGFGNAIEALEIEMVQVVAAALWKPFPVPVGLHQNDVRCVEELRALLVKN